MDSKTVRKVGATPGSPDKMVGPGLEPLPTNAVAAEQGLATLSADGGPGLESPPTNGRQNCGGSENGSAEWSLAAAQPQSHSQIPKEYLASDLSTSQSASPLHQPTTSTTQRQSPSKQQERSSQQKQRSPVPEPERLIKRSTPQQDHAPTQRLQRSPTSPRRSPPQETELPTQRSPMLDQRPTSANQEMRTQRSPASIQRSTPQDPTQRSQRSPISAQRSTPPPELVDEAADVSEPITSLSTLQHPRGEEPPELPPRPPHLALPPPGNHVGAQSDRQAALPNFPPHAASAHHARSHHRGNQITSDGEPGERKSWFSRLARKYVVMTCVCGGLCVLLGVLFLTIHLVVVSRTSSTQYFQTVPTYIPAIVLILTGVLVSIFSKGGARHPTLIKVCGCFCLLSSAVCVAVVITTTVIHMNRLQTLRECVYQSSSKTCTCFAGLVEAGTIQHHSAARYVFLATSDCDVVHGTLYSCLRAVFGLSVIGILLSIFCCMLVYQILSHERKKQYLEQLDSQCRNLYCRRSGMTRSNHTYCQIDYFNYRLWGRRCDNLYSPTPANTLSTRTGTPSTYSSSLLPPPSTYSASSMPWASLMSRAATCADFSLPGTGNSSCQHGPLQERWRHSHADEVYGFRPSIETSRQVMSSYTVTDLYNKLNHHLQQNDSLPNLLWGPPPPYSSQETSPNRDGVSGDAATASEAGPAADRAAAVTQAVTTAVVQQLHQPVYSCSSTTDSCYSHSYASIGPAESCISTSTPSSHLSRQSDPLPVLADSSGRTFISHENRLAGRAPQQEAAAVSQQTAGVVSVSEAGGSLPRSGPCGGSNASGLVAAIKTAAQAANNSSPTKNHLAAKKMTVQEGSPRTTKSGLLTDRTDQVSTNQQTATNNNKKEKSPCSETGKELAYPALQLRKSEVDQQEEDLRQIKEALESLEQERAKIASIQNVYSRIPEVLEQKRQLNALTNQQGHIAANKLKGMSLSQPSLVRPHPPQHLAQPSQGQMHLPTKVHPPAHMHSASQMHQQPPLPPPAQMHPSGQIFHSAAQVHPFISSRQKAPAQPDGDEVHLATVQLTNHVNQSGQVKSPTVHGQHSVQVHQEQVLVGPTGPVHLPAQLRPADHAAHLQHHLAQMKLSGQAVPQPPGNPANQLVHSADVHNVNSLQHGQNHPSSSAMAIHPSGHSQTFAGCMDTNNQCGAVQAPASQPIMQPLLLGSSRQPHQQIPRSSPVEAPSQLVTTSINSLGLPGGQTQRPYGGCQPGQGHKPASRKSSSQPAKVQSYNGSESVDWCPISPAPPAQPLQSNIHSSADALSNSLQMLTSTPANVWRPKPIQDGGYNHQLLSAAGLLPGATLGLASPRASNSDPNLDSAHQLNQGHQSLITPVTSVSSGEHGGGGVVSQQVSALVSPTRNNSLPALIKPLAQKPPHCGGSIGDRQDHLLGQPMASQIAAAAHLYNSVPMGGCSDVNGGSQDKDGLTPYHHGHVNKSLPDFGQFQPGDAAASSQCNRDIVLLRAEQNIPDTFTRHKFKPIQADTSDKAGHATQQQTDRQCSAPEADPTDIYNSSDDIVLTLRSVQV